MRSLSCTILLVIYASVQIISQDVYATQSWELTFDKQLDGWVDSGDRIRITSMISTYDSLIQELTFYNPIASPYLSLVPNSTTSSHGNIIASDKVEVQNISIKTPGEQVKISFDYEVDFPIEEAATLIIQNQSLVKFGNQEIASNMIDISIKGQHTYEDGSFLSDKYWGVLTLSVVGFLLVYIFYRPKYSQNRLVAN